MRGRPAILLARYIRGDRFKLFTARFEARSHGLRVEINRYHFMPCSQELARAGVSNATRSAPVTNTVIGAAI